MHPGTVDIEHGCLCALGQRPKDCAAALGLSPHVNACRDGARITGSISGRGAAGAQLQVDCTLGRRACNAVNGKAVIPLKCFDRIGGIRPIDAIRLAG